MKTDLLTQLNRARYSFFFLVTDPYLDIDLYDYLDNFHLIFASLTPKVSQLKSQGKPYFCLEETGSTLRQKNTGLLLSHPLVQDYINRHSRPKAAVIPFKPSSKIDFICLQQGYHKVANDAPLNRLFEDKIKFLEICSQNNLPTIPSTVDRLTPETYRRYQQLYGPTLVVQTHFGWAGQSTYKSINYSDLESRLAPETVVKFSPYLKGYSLLNNCCLTSGGLLQSPPALQYTGLPQFTQNEFTTVGRQWPSLASPKVQNQVKQLTAKFSAILKTHSYQGFFGLDFFVDLDGHVYLLECNPRLTASFAFYTYLEQKAGLTPMFYYHLAEFLDLKLSLTQAEIDQRFNHPAIVGSELTPKDDQGHTLTKINSDTALTTTINPISLPSDIINK